MTSTYLRALALLAAAALSACSDDDGGGGKFTPGGSLSLNVGGYFPAGTTVRDAYSGKTAVVGAGGAVSLTPDPAGVVLLEKDGAAPSPFTWANSTVYFVITDRFKNGDPSNDSSYGRQKDGATETGTWHGGDFAGLTQQLDYIKELGVTAIWITPPVEQVRGWVSGGSAPNDFQHYAYHGYWALDFTKLDRNLGTTDELRTFVDQAHARGIRVLFDVVMNHPGYATGADLLEFLPAVFKDGTGDAFRAFTRSSSPQGWVGWNDLVNYNGTTAWTGWWGPKWIRAGFLQHQTDNSSDTTLQLSFLPDLKTESTEVAGLPPLLTRKSDTLAAELPNGTVRDYLVKWHTDWVRAYGIDGFRCDTTKNVDLPSWKALKDAAVPALAAWKAANPSKKLDDAPFWMTGEVFPHGVVKDSYFGPGGFDSVINFDFQRLLEEILDVTPALANDPDKLEAIYSSMASKLVPDDSFDVLSYLSSHDTKLFLKALDDSTAKMWQAGTALLLAPGGVQIFYGDESGRRLGNTPGDVTQGTRSDMNWSSLDSAMVHHWRKVGSFRKAHAAVGDGAHERLTSPAGTYAFGRKRDKGGQQDAVVVVLTAPQ